MGALSRTRALLVCLLTGGLDPVRAEDPAARAEMPASTPAATSTAPLLPAATASAIPASPSAAAVSTAGASAVAARASGTTTPRERRPPPVAVFVPLGGTVMLPLSLPTAVPHARQGGAPSRPATKEEP